MRHLLVLPCLSLLLACGEDSSSDPSDELPSTYRFESRFGAADSVVYTGQVGRPVLILEMTADIGSWDDTTFSAASEGQVVDRLSLWFDFKNVGGAPGDEISLSYSLPLLQSTFGEVGSLVSLAEKMPEVDAAFTGGVRGAGDGSLTPTQVVETLFDELEDLVLARRDGSIPLDPDGAAIPEPFVNAEGVDYQQLLQKFLTGAVAYSQGSDDYLDDDVPGKGLLSDNSTAVVGKAYTALEHAWDEGFGYFGATRDFADYTDEEIAAKGGRTDRQGHHDSDGDGMIDLTAEVVFGHAANAAKRDLGSAGSADFTREAFNAFIAGRALISSTDELSAAELEELRGYRDTAVGAWEKSIAATAIHYVNDVLADMADFDSVDYSFSDHAKHWSELKGFSLVLQFNPNNSLVPDSSIGAFIDAVGDAPVLPGDSTAAADYATQLGAARDALGLAYGFSTAQVEGW
jgi:hypothetical protein